MRMIKISLLILPAIICFRCADSDNNNGWIDIMPGENLAGWSIHSIPAGEKVAEPSQWIMNTHTGILRCDGSGGHEWLRYDGRTFSDFVFRVEWRFIKRNEQAKYNSGVYVRNSADCKIWHQAQTGDASGGYIFGNTLVDGAVKRINTKDKLTTSHVKPAGEWNTFDITCKDNAIFLDVNGRHSVSWNKCEVLSGYLGLEAEGYEIEFRKIEVRELK